MKSTTRWTKRWQLKQPHNMMSLKMLECGGTEMSELPCPTCLTPGRSLLPLRDASRAYSTLLAGVHSYEQIMDFVMTARVCWECLSFLNKVVRFQRQVFDANSFLHSFAGIDKCEVMLPPFTRLATASTLGFNMEFKHEEDMWDIDVDPDPCEAVKLEYENASKSEADKPKEPAKKKKKRASAKKKERERDVKKKNWPGKKVVLTGINKNVKIVSVPMDESEFQRIRDEDRRGDQYAKSPHKCETCIKGFAHVSMLEKHINNYHSEAIGPHACSVCGMRFAKELGMRRHRRGHYKLYVCSKCGFPHRYLTVVLRHYNAAHEPGKRFPCDQCGENFESGRKMRYHRQMTHKAIYQCEYCDKILSTSQSLSYHMLTHTGMPMLECSLCHKSCRGVSGLQSHMRTAHTVSDNAEEAYCKECDIQFKNKSIYKTHLKKSPKHNPPSLFKFPCDQCDKRFISETVLKHHHRKYHLEYICHICQKKLANEFVLGKHIKFVHEGYQLPRKHVCEVCGKAFKTKRMLKQHTYVHTGERPHACDICSATFAQKSTLQTHQRLIHFKLGKNSARATTSAAPPAPNVAPITNAFAHPQY